MSYVKNADRELLAGVKPIYKTQRYVRQEDLILLAKLKAENMSKSDISHTNIHSTDKPTELNDVKSSELNDDALSFIRKIADARKMSLSDAVSEMYHSYPWHVMACETDQKRLYDSGIVITVKEDLMDVMNRERARYYVMGRNNKKIEELPVEVGSLINA